MSEKLSGEEVFKIVEEKLLDAELEKDYSITEKELIERTIKSNELYETLEKGQS